MAKYEAYDKDIAFDIEASHSHGRMNRTWKPNVEHVKAAVNDNPKHIYIYTCYLRSSKVTRAVWRCKTEKFGGT